MVRWVCFALFITCVLAVFASLGIADQPVDFGRDVRPLLQEHCGECHGTRERNGGLSFEDKTSLFTEADSGEFPIVAGDPDQSELIKRVRSSDDGDQMPPDGDRLSEAEIDLLSRWVAAGALWSDADAPDAPTEVSARASSLQHWAFQPLRQVQPPEVDDAAWPLNPLDRFLQARREQAGLAVTPDADPVAFIRRVNYALTGLPPTPQEVDDFITSAKSATGLDQTVAHHIEQLLSRPAYGERWGRHWMDWVRYADTAGDNSDYPIPQAYLYRNYIIDAFNDDLPYDRFVTEQIAGDLLPYDSQSQRNRQLIATGYLAMARRFGSLVERYPWHLTIEDTIDNLGRTLLGMTLACARCHDHKFDPISTRDYYGLYGIFAGTRYPFPGIELFQTQMDLMPLIPDAEADEITGPYQATTDTLRAELQLLLDKCEQQALENAAVSGRVTLDERRKLDAKLDGMLLSARKAGEKLAAHLKTIPMYPTAYAVREGEPKNARVQIKGEPVRLGAEVPRKFPDVLGGHRLSDQAATSTSGRLQLAQWITSPENPLTARVIVNRVWQRHFGVGLVPSASDFGLRGEQPTHPELLDWLAAEFINSGWSIKHLHRLIMNSRTYRLSSSDREANLAVDPGNRLYWKFNRQRLDAESIRDTLLWIAGSLDATMQSEPHPFPPSKDWKYTQHHPFKDNYASNRRSVYLMTKRLTAQPYFQTFDGADPNVCTSDRDQSVTALQALYFVNDEFLHQQADRLATQMLGADHPDEQRLNQAFRMILSRPPTSSEATLLQQHLTTTREVVAKEQLVSGNSDREAEAWASLLRSLMRLNEFLYVD